ncbi:MAG: SRPBCC family protein [Deltaproteobacteria bacterium]|nr:SRPBCC family protein [Deltaproteobacteria bacterium]
MEFHTEREIDASAAEVWCVLGEGFGDVSWSTGIDSSSLEGELGVGCLRTCNFPPSRLSKSGSVRETLVQFDREAMTLAYEVQPTPGVMKSAINRWSITPLGAERCRVRSHATLEFRGLAVVFGPLMRPMIRRMGARFVDDLAERVAATRRVSAA